ncbi:MAG: 2-C-methyl-D-erythritol 4-phosphate cytidylyltransferase [Rheinheimera sp.]|nr:2-C-methyl-D-erythritol 4-phosphate cytidylyltransferase [Rheinheimera sp.]
MSSNTAPAIAAIMPAAGVGSRMQSAIPKQYLQLQGKTILEHSVARLQALPCVKQLWLALAADDAYFAATPLQHADIQRVKGGAERMHSVLNALTFIDEHHYPWVLVHDAARPLVRKDDIEKLITRCLAQGEGGILACRVRDTMKRGESTVAETVNREHLWHALTPQFFPTAMLRAALKDAIQAGMHITDEASAMEWAGHKVLLVEGGSDNIKITQPADLALAAFYLEQSQQ